MAKSEYDKYGHRFPEGGLRDHLIGDEEIKGLDYVDQGEYRVFHKKCKQCKQEFTVSIPLNFFKATLPPEMNRDIILKQIKKECCYNCKQESEIDQ